jgi:hypothetical protein
VRFVAAVCCGKVKMVKRKLSYESTKLNNNDYNSLCGLKEKGFRDLQEKVVWTYLFNKCESAIGWFCESQQN